MKTLLLNIIFALMLLSYYLDYELRNERKSITEAKNQLKIDYNISLDSLINEIRIKDSIVNDIEGIVKDKKDCNRFKRIYNKAK